MREPGSVLVRHTGMRKLFCSLSCFFVSLVMFGVPVEAQAAPVPLVDVGRHDSFFSPNGDGVADRARFRFDLTKRSVVLVQVTDRTHKVVRKVRLGTLSPGRHTWRWNGKARGEVQPDGWYAVNLRVWSGRRSELTGWETRIVTVPDAGRIVLSRPTVYPAATVVRDRLAVVYVRDDYEVYEDRYPGYFDLILPLHTRLVIKAPDGDRVFASSRRTYRPVFSWAARDKQGRALPPGSYRLKLTVADPVGNVRTIRRTVEVSAAQLARQVWTSTMPAADFQAGSPPTSDPSCNGCGDVCGPVPSEMYPGGLSFVEPCAWWAYATVKHFAVKPPVRPAAVDSFRVKAAGGPPVDGGTGIGHLDGLVMGPGEDTVTTPWRRVDLVDYPYLPERREVVTWSFSTSQDNDYDVATFTVEYRYYVPVG